MPILDKAKVAIGLHKKSKLDLSHSHITTSNFMDMQPVCYRHMIPQEKYRVNAHAFARLAPLTVPTYGRARLNLRGFFVPFRTVMPHFNDFIVDVRSVAPDYSNSNRPIIGIANSTPYFTNVSLWTLFTSTFGVYGQNISFTEVATSSNYDFCSGSVYYRLTAYGRRFYKILRSLGYVVVSVSKGTKRYSALALMCYLRVYYDWYSVSAYADTNTYLLFDSWFKWARPDTPLELTYLDLSKIAGFIFRVCYDGDYFTAAWDTPTAPNDSIFSPFTIPDITNVDSDSINVATSSNGTPVVEQSDDTSLVVMTQYADDALHALTDYMKRHQLAGARTIDRYLADFGINLPADKLNRSTYLGMSSIDIRIGDVMSHSDTSQDPSVSNLGDYAGKGIADGGKSFEFVASEFGLFLIVSSILPSGGYVQGIDRNNMHLTKDEFFLPDFDNLGVQAIAKGELYVSKNDTFVSTILDYDKTFGYTPRYAEYKVARDQVTGDFSTSVMAGGDSWHLSRMFDDAYFGGSFVNVQHDLDFCIGSDADQYSRIFNNTDSDVDKFYIVYQFDASAIAPCQSLFDTYQFENESKKITMDSNGVKMN